MTELQERLLRCTPSQIVYKNDLVGVKDSYSDVVYVIKDRYGPKHGILITLEQWEEFKSNREGTKILITEEEVNKRRCRTCGQPLRNF